MLADDISEQAIGRWFAHGVTSCTHPVLHFMLRTFFHPFGIEADAIEAEPFSNLETGLGDWWLQGPRWNPRGFDRIHPAATDFGYLLDAPMSFHVSISPHGWLLIEPAENAGKDLAVTAFMETTEQGWLAARHSLQAAREAEAFLYGAVGALLSEESLALLYAGGDDDTFCAAVRESTIVPAPAPNHTALNHRSTNAAVSSAAVRATVVR